MRKDAKNSKKHVISWILLLFVSCGLIVSCTAYNPAFYPSYDVLKPGPEVEKNPIGHIEYNVETNEYTIVWGDKELVFVPSPDGRYVIIDSYMVQWVGEIIEWLEKLEKK